MKKLTMFAGLIVVALLLNVSANAQKSSAGVGLRATPDGGGFTIKAFMSPHLAFEGQMNVGGLSYINGQSFTAVALLEGHIMLPDPSWRLFFGGGLHAGVWDNNGWYRKRDNEWIYNRAEPVVGMDAIGGVEYIFKKIPLGLSADMKPAVNFTNRGPEFFPHNMFGVAARYYFR